MSKNISIGTMCCVQNCENIFEGHCDLQFFHFPTNKKSRQTWCDALEMDIKSITKNHVICDAHFPDDMLTISINKQLSADAVPMAVKGNLVEIEIIESGDGEEILGYEYLDESFDIDDKPHLEIDSIDAGTYYPCDICNLLFLTREERNQHIDDHFKIHTCNTCGKSFEGLRKFEHHRNTPNCQRTNPNTKYDTFECFVCHQGNFFSLRSLKIHFNRNHKSNQCIQQTKKINNDNRCKICNKTFANVYIMKTHMTDLHTQAKSFACDVCGKEFNRAANLRWHRLIHDNLLPCTCKICGKAFRTISGLNLHKRTHTGEKPYLCDICHEKSYAYNTDLKRHKRSVHGIIDKTFPCTLCDQVFYEPKFLRKHMNKAHSDK